MADPNEPMTTADVASAIYNDCQLSLPYMPVADFRSYRTGKLFCFRIETKAGPHAVIICRTGELDRALAALERR